MTGLSNDQLPEWVPIDVIRYLKHTEAHCSIRQLARDAGCHASTVLRQIRKLEGQRDDLLIESALERLADVYFRKGDEEERTVCKTREVVYCQNDIAQCLSRLSHAGAQLIVGRDLEKAVIVRETEGDAERFVLDRLVPEILALKEWISCTARTRVYCYRITQNGRVALAKLVAAAEDRARTQNETLTQSGMAGILAHSADLIQLSERPRRARYGQQETPLQVLARMQDRDGNPFLNSEMIKSGERLREDYELAQIGRHLATEQAVFADGTQQREDLRGFDPSKDAFQRMSKALYALGPGLSDIALRCCCHLEGLEAAERHLGWSARSGKIVLRIALEQLHRHYAQQPPQSQMIG